MWHAIRAALRERKTSLNKPSLTASKRFQHNVALQLDYYLSPQFAGVAAAIVNGTYVEHGLGKNITILPTCPVGFEQERVRNYQNENPNHVVLGSVEQNIFIPTLAKQPELKTTAVAAMFAASPLCIASLQSTHESLKSPMVIGAHEDTIDLMKRVFPQHKVVASPRATKNTDLLSGKLDAIQAYTTTEIPTLKRMLADKDDDVVVTMLDGNGQNHLGYSQVLFASNESLQGDQIDITRAFLQATFDGWEFAIRNPEQAVEMVQETKKMLALDDEMNDHWYQSTEYDVEMCKRCNDYVKATFQGDRYGVIDPQRWNKATKWLLEGDQLGPPSTDFGFEKGIWVA